MSIDDIPLRPGFDHSTDVMLREHHYDEWVRLQDEQRAFRSDISDPFGYSLWYLLRYDDIRDALQDPGLFSSRTVQYLGDSDQRMLPLELDPPAHTPYRQLLSAPLSPGNVQKLEPEVRALAVELIEGLVDAGSCEFVHDVALRFPTTMFLRLMGLSTDRTDELVGHARALLHTSPNDDPDQSIRGGAVLSIIGHLAEALAKRREQPGDDLLGQIVGATVEGRPLTDEELLAMAFLLYVAGLDTVANVLAYSMRHLADSPQVRSSLVANPDRWPIAVEELLRYYSIATTSRVVTRDTEFAGCPMKAGDRVVLPTGAAGRDPRQFEDADEFQADRAVNRHLAFGAGPHRCVGSHLARLEMRIAMEEWHRLIPEYRIAPGVELREHVGAVAGLDQLPLTW
ncbi:MAG: Cytochrome, partial [Acidimicrobiales bacterium]|nr:Cytochrome [Acidimicrobiales bacterium]